MTTMPSMQSHSLMFYDHFRWSISINGHVWCLNVLTALFCGLALSAFIAGHLRSNTLVWVAHVTLISQYIDRDKADKERRDRHLYHQRGDTVIQRVLMTIHTHVLGVIHSNHSMAPWPLLTLLFLNWTIITCRYCLSPEQLSSFECSAVNKAKAWKELFESAQVLTEMTYSSFWRSTLGVVQSTFLRWTSNDVAIVIKMKGGVWEEVC